MIIINVIVLAGRLSQNPVLKQSGAGKPYCQFSLAVSKAFKKEGDTTNFFNCLVFGKQAESLCKYQQKGSLISVSGSVEFGSYTDKNGTNVKTTTVMVSGMEFLGGKDQSINAFGHDQIAKTKIYGNDGVDKYPEKKETPVENDFGDGFEFDISNENLPF